MARAARGIALGTPVHRQTTPFSVTLGASDGYFDRMDYTTRFHKACHEDYETQVDSSLNPWYFGNLFFGGLIGMLIGTPLPAPRGSWTPRSAWRAHRRDLGPRGCADW